MGEEITDIYHYGKILARPLKEPILALELGETETFAGGVTAAAQIAGGFCEVEVLSTASVVKERFIEKSHVRKLFEVYRDYKIKDAWVGIADGFDLIAVLDYGHGMFTESLVKHIEALGVPFSQVMQIATFYKTFSLKPKGRHEVHVCTGTSCHLRGAARLLAAVQRQIGIKPGETDPESRFSLETGSCLGSCSIGPEVIVDGTHHARMTPAKVEDVLKRYR